MKVAVSSPPEATTSEVMDALHEFVLGRNVGETYVVDVSRKRRDEILLELRDGTKFVLSCKQTL